jgi:tetratricopeptide (TPR) repeat protein
VFDYLAFSLSRRRTARRGRRAGSRAIKLLPEKGQEYRLCESHRTLGNIYTSKGEREKAIHHFETALGIASSFNWHDLLFWIHYDLAQLFSEESKFDDAHAHIEQAKSHVVNDAYLLGRATELQAQIWYDNAGSKRRHPRLCTRSRSMRSSGQRGI